MTIRCFIVVIIIILNAIKRKRWKWKSLGEVATIFSLVVVVFFLLYREFYSRFVLLFGRNGWSSQILSVCMCILCIDIFMTTLYSCKNPMFSSSTNETNTRKTETEEIISFHRIAIKQWHWLVIPLNSHEKHIYQ